MLILNLMKREPDSLNVPPDIHLRAVAVQAVTDIYMCPLPEKPVWIVA